MSRKRNTERRIIDEEFNMLENILEEQGEARRFTKEEEKKIRIYKKPWMDEFLNGKLIALTKEKEGELRERYKEKYGEYPPESNDKVYLCGCVHNAFTDLPK